MKNVEKAFSLFVETLPLEKTDINTESFLWHDLYSKECELFGLLAKMNEDEGYVYKIRVQKYMFNDSSYSFSFETDSQFNEQKYGTNRISDYRIVRMVIKYDDGSTCDFPIHTREEYKKLLSLYAGSIENVYQSMHYYDIYDYID
jgi:hypothetical protein